MCTGEEPEVWNWACSQYVGQLIYANVYGVTSAAYVLLTTLGNTSKSITVLYLAYCCFKNNHKMEIQGCQSEGGGGGGFLD